MNKGIFLDGSIIGLTYSTETRSGVTDHKGQYTYNDGETITFSIGRLMLGSCPAKAMITPVDFVAEASRRSDVLSHYQVLNITRFLMALGTITEADIEAINKYYTAIDFVKDTEFFQGDPVICSIMGNRKRIDPNNVKNTLRRCINGIYKEKDVKIPVRDGGYVLADVYRPLKEGKYPVIMCMGVFGKSFVNGFEMNEADSIMAENAENKFYEDYDNVETKHMLQGIFFKRMGPCFGSALPVPNVAEGETEAGHQGPPPCLVPVSEAFEQPCAMDWVPYGYTVINIEERGVGANETEDLFKQFGVKNAQDYCDAIEWAADQEWSSGNIGLFGASYYAMTQYLAAQRKPKGLKAMVPIMGDYDSYRDYIYSGGGLFNRADNMDPVTKPQSRNFMTKAMEEPFWNEETYGPEGEYMSSCDISKIDLPIWPAVEPDASLHGKGSSEAYINCSSKEKKLLVISGCGIHFWMYNKEHLNNYRKFFDKYLKGEENDIMDQPPVSIQIRTGEGTYHWRHEADWPVPGTSYVKFYLDCAEGSLTTGVPAGKTKITYNADVKRSLTRRVPGATFISAPFEEDTELAGYIKASLNVSSTTTDMEIHMNVRVIDENNNEVIFPARTSMERELPLGFGSMKASHRILDENRTRDYLPVYKHTKEAWAPLTPDTLVTCEVGTFPTTGFIKKGWKLRLDIDPVSNRWVDYNEAAYRTGSKNTIYSSRQEPSYVQIPVLPKN